MSSEPSKRNNLFTMLHRSFFFSLRITLSIFPYLFIPYMYEKLRSSFVFFILPFSIIYWLDMIYFLVRGRGFDTKWYFYIYIYLYINEWIAFIVYFLWILFYSKGFLLFITLSWHSLSFGAAYFICTSLSWAMCWNLTVTRV